ncbi:MAG: radical SAM protein [Vicinamibacteria bacterium]|jgi:7-carboxy-7-deazaguanine synthase|nr:radical SAM protein [Vicinamibacteria bacterium]
MLSVNEIFLSIQGEGTRAGCPCVFVRLAGCPLSCHYCDSRFARGEGHARDEAEVLAEIARYPYRLIELTGGEPLSQAAAFPFVTRLIDAGWDVLVETSGHIPLFDLDRRAAVIMDIKTPGSGEVHRTEWRNLEWLTARDEIKIVVVDRADYEWARDLIQREELAKRCPVLLSPVHDRVEPAQLARWMLHDGLPARLQIQLHKYVWPGVERGK